MVEGYVFCQEPNPLPGIRVAEGLAQHSSLPGRRPHESHCQMDGGTLARAIGTQEPEDLALLHGEREILQSPHRACRKHAPILLRDTFEFQNWNHHGLF